MSIINKLKDSFRTRKINIFLIFLMLSFSFLILTKLSKNYTQTLSFHINRINVPEEVIIVEDSSSKLDITIKTYGFKFLSYVFYKPKLEIDFAKLNTTSRYYVWSNKNNSDVINQFDSNVEIISINPDTLFFTYDRNFVKMVPVRLHKAIQFTSGYDILNDIKPIPDSIKVIGPKTILDSIGYVDTEPLRLKEVNKSIKTDLKLLPTSNPQVVYSKKSVSIEAKVEKFTEGVLEIPITVLNVPESISLSYYPKKIKVYFYTSLNDFKKISRNDFRIECDFKSINNSGTYLTPKIKLKPNTVKNIRLNTNKVDFIITNSK